MRSLFLSAVLLLGPGAVPAESTTPVCGFVILAEYPHDDGSFTQGLAFDDDCLDFYEGSGLYGESTLRRVDLQSGVVLESVDLDASLFGEGITVTGEEIIQLTWQENTALRWNRADFSLLESFSYSTEGWGLSDDGQHLIMSDGSGTLYFRNPVNFSEFGSVEVLDDGASVTHLNELEWVNGEILANVWQTDEILRIDPETGKVIARIDLSSLPRPESADVLNGIAWDYVGRHLYVTGKLWPSLYEISLSNCPDLPLFRDGFGFGDTSAWSWQSGRSAAEKAQPRPGSPQGKAGT